VQLNIRKSVVLIDELELHLHPPEQQSLLAHLPGICPASQFLLTSHSEHVVGGFPQERITRLEGGRPCL
jgi:predicted ATP-binding protein involved in virulence